MRSPVSRRRFLSIAAAAAGCGALARLGEAAAAEPPLYRWRGTALGAEASLLIYHPDERQAQRLVEDAVAELRRLEAIFSLYRSDSALALLNRDGALEAPPVELVELLAASQGFGTLTGGVFDVTVQPLWTLYAAHFADPDADPAGPPVAAIAGAARRVDYRRIEVESGRVRLRPGMAVTLNGIAQGYITDRIADQLEAAGLERVLVDLGEMRALGTPSDGDGWPVSVRDPVQPDRVIGEVALRHRALATSSGYGTPFERTGRFNHLFDPQTGRCADRYRSVSVMAARATEADALSTAFSLMDEVGIQDCLERRRGVTALLADEVGVRTLTSGGA
jgi:thiamine biosynthesis lipoprotein